MVKRNKFKYNTLLKENILNSFKIKKFYKKKWWYQKFILRKNNYKIKLFTYKQFLIKNKKYNFKFHYKNLLNFKRKLYFLCSYIRYKRLKKYINKQSFLSLTNIKFNLSKNLILKNNFTNRLDYIILFFESSLYTIILRSNLLHFNKVNILNYIKNGFIKVNNITVKNPWFNLKVGDIVSFHFIKKKYNIIKLYKPKHLVINYKKKYIIYSSYPNILDLEYSSFYEWRYIKFLKNLKKL